jgi:hypothetical protein
VSLKDQVLSAAEQARNAPEPTDALRHLAQVGDLPLVAHNGATFDGPLIKATCQRLAYPPSVAT